MYIQYKDLFYRVKNKFIALNFVPIEYRYVLFPFLHTCGFYIDLNRLIWRTYIYTFE
jgi:hypothetical protein